jgi:hypothetical protein
MSSPKPTAAQRKAAEKRVKPMLQMLHDPALWGLRTDLIESETPEATLYLSFVDSEITGRLVIPAKPSRRSYEEITE